MKTVTIEIIVNDEDVQIVREKVTYFLNEQFGYEEDVDFIF